MTIVRATTVTTEIAVAVPPPATRATTVVVEIAVRVTGVSVQDPPTTGTDGAAIAPITVIITRNGVKDAAFNGLVRAAKKAGAPVLSGTLQVSASAGEAVFSAIVATGLGPVTIEFDAPDDPDLDPIDIIVDIGEPAVSGGLTTLFRTSTASTFRR